MGLLLQLNSCCSEDVSIHWVKSVLISPISTSKIINARKSIFYFSLQYGNELFPYRYFQHSSLLDCHLISETQCSSLNLMTFILLTDNDWGCFTNNPIYVELQETYRHTANCFSLGYLNSFSWTKVSNTGVTNSCFHVFCYFCIGITVYQPNESEP